MKIQFKNRQLELFKCLITATAPISIEVLSEKFKKSERTIRYDLNTIRDEVEPLGVEIKIKSKKGYYIPAEQKRICSKILAEVVQSDETSLLDDSPQARFATLLLYFVCSKQTVTADEIADKFYISRSTALRLISGMDENYADSNISIIQRSGGYTIQSDELNLRKCAAGILVNLFKGSYSPEDWYMLLPSIMKDQITLADINRISKAIKKVNGRYDVWISNMAYINLVCYCIIRDIRMRKGIYVSKVSEEFDEISQKAEFEYAYQLLHELSIPYYSFDDAELKWMMDQANANGIFVNQQCDSQIELSEMIDEMLSILKENKHNFAYKFDTLTLYDDLFEHLQHAVLKQQIESEDNSVLEEIKTKYADFYLLAQDCAAACEKKVGYAISENEISYIAIYLYKNLISESVEKKKVLVVCATGKGLSNLLTTRIKNVFHNIAVVNQVSPYQLGVHQIPKDIDFIISTIPLDNVSLPVVKISRILSAEDIQRIQEFMLYGKFIDAIPFSQQDSASFNTKADPFGLYDVSFDASNDFASSSIVLSKLILTLLEYTAKFPKEYEMNQDALLGLTIHMIMAVPRWFAAAPINMEDDLLIQDYEQIARDHSIIFSMMEKFFHLVEESLMVTIPISERHAFFLYIIKNKEEEFYEKSAD